MTRGEKIIYFGVPATLVGMVCLYEACVVAVGDGSIPVAVNTRSGKPFEIRRVTYDHFGRQEEIDECLQYPQFNVGLFRDVLQQGQDWFQFDVLTSDHISPFGIFRNQFAWRRFAVFRIETTAGEVQYIGVEVPDPRTNRSITIDMP